MVGDSGSRFFFHALVGIPESKHVKILVVTRTGGSTQYESSGLDSVPEHHDTPHKKNHVFSTRTYSSKCCAGSFLSSDVRIVGDDSVKDVQF